MQQQPSTTLQHRAAHPLYRINTNEYTVRMHSARILAVFDFSISILVLLNRYLAPFVSCFFRPSLALYLQQSYKHMTSLSEKFSSKSSVSCISHQSSDCCKYHSFVYSVYMPRNNVGLLLYSMVLPWCILIFCHSALA